MKLREKVSHQNSLSHCTKLISGKNEISVQLYVPHSVLSLTATLPAAQDVQELAPSVLMVFPSQILQNVLLAGW